MARICNYKIAKFNLFYQLTIVHFALKNRTYLKNMDQGSGQGTGQRKSGAYTVVCEHFLLACNPATGGTLGPQTRF